jgi:pyruvate kinase
MITQRITKSYQSNTIYLYIRLYLLNQPKGRNCLIESIIDTVVKMTYQTRFNLIIAFSDDIEIANQISKYRPNCLVIFPTSNEEHLKYLRVIRGILGVIVNYNTQDETINNILTHRYNDYVPGNSKVLILNLYRQCKNKYFYVKHI